MAIGIEDIDKAALQELIRQELDRRGVGIQGTGVPTLQGLMPFGAYFDGRGGVNIFTSKGVSGITRTGAGLYTVSLSPGLSVGPFFAAFGYGANSNTVVTSTGTITTSRVDLRCRDAATGTNTDDLVSFVGLG